MDRRQFLHAALKERMDALPKGSADSRTKRFDWLAEQLENYVERLLGFLSLASFDSASLANDDSFLMVESARELLDDELNQDRSAPASRVVAWKHFCAAWAECKARPDASSQEALRQALIELRSAGD